MKVLMLQADFGFSRAFPVSAHHWLKKY